MISLPPPLSKSRTAAISFVCLSGGSGSHEKETPEKARSHPSGLLFVFGAGGQRFRPGQGRRRGLVCDGQRRGTKRQWNREPEQHPGPAHRRVRFRQ